MDDTSWLPNADRSRAWWSDTLAAFASQPSEAIVERLASCAMQSHIINYIEQLPTWHRQSQLLAQATTALPRH